MLVGRWSNIGGVPFASFRWPGDAWYRVGWSMRLGVRLEERLAVCLVGGACLDICLRFVKQEVEHYVLR